MLPTYLTLFSLLFLDNIHYRAHFQGFRIYHLVLFCSSSIKSTTHIDYEEPISQNQNKYIFIYIYIYIYLLLYEITLEVFVNHMLRRLFIGLMVFLEP